jgi:PAS domain S-box-containing protein
MKKLQQMTKAELIKRVKTLETSAPTASIASERQQLLHELHVHQIELETQNRELREAQLLLEVSRDRYADLYDFAPVGYVTFDDKGVIREINLTAARMLGVERTRLVGMRFHLHVVREDLAQFREHLGKLENQEEGVVTELRLARKGGGALRVVMQSVLVPDGEKKGWLHRASLTDITARLQAEEALRASNRRLQKVLEVENVGVMFWDLSTGVMIDANDTLLRFLGYSRREVEARELTWRRLTPPEYVAASLEELRKFATTGRVGPYEKEYLHKDGSRQWFVFAGSALGDGTVVEFCVDVSERKRVEEALRENEERLELVLDASEIGTFEINLVTGEAHWNTVEFELLGLRPGEAPPGPETFFRFVHPDDREHLRALWEEAPHTGEFNAEFRIVRADGQERWLAGKGRFAFGDQAGWKTPKTPARGARFLGVNFDITERKRAEEALRDNEARLHAVLDTAADGIITIDERGTIESFNQAAEKLFGYPAREAIGQNIGVLIPSPYREEYDRYLSDYRDTGERKILGMGRELSGRRKDDSIFPLELSVSEVRLGGRRIFTGFVRDITKRRQAEEALCASEGMLSRAQEMAHVGGYEINATGTGGDHWSEETFRILGLDPATRELTLTEHVLGCVHPEDRARVREAFDKARNERVRFDLEYRIVRPDASIRHVHSIVEPVPGADDQTVKLVGTLQDITERKELEKEILAISEREQSRIGQDLHDGLCQHLAGIEFRLLGLKQKLDAKSSKQAAETTELAKLVRQGIEQTRTLARGLSPVMLEPGGLMNALQELATNTVTAFDISCSLNCPRPVLMHNNAAATHLYRIAQEAIQNAIRHGKANSIVINLFTQHDRIVLGVKDDGVGFSKKPLKHNGMGLRVMQYRAAMVGGSLAVQHEPAGGTSVVCSLRADGTGQETARPKGK